MIRFHGVLAPSFTNEAKLRAMVVPDGSEAVTVESELAGRLKIIAAILESAVIKLILKHQALQARQPPRAPARERQLAQPA